MLHMTAKGMMRRDDIKLHRDDTPSFSIELTQDFGKSDEHEDVMKKAAYPATHPSPAENKR
ncbi:hypothetical protein CASFOL_004438 [Castilleja foliolosa]|uniref:Uncharacterized protein n=1 Tax=Castilleja foliolosa TaxID=1961234 RepID=A0ABD3EB94_9LAMI